MINPPDISPRGVISTSPMRADWHANDAETSPCWRCRPSWCGLTNWVDGDDPDPHRGTSFCAPGQLHQRQRRHRLSDGPLPTSGSRGLRLDGGRPVGADPQGCCRSRLCRIRTEPCWRGGSEPPATSPALIALSDGCSVLGSRARVPFVVRFKTESAPCRPLSCFPSSPLKRSRPPAVASRQGREVLHWRLRRHPWCRAPRSPIDHPPLRRRGAPHRLRRRPGSGAQRRRADPKSLGPSTFTTVQPPWEPGRWPGCRPTTTPGQAAPLTTAWRSSNVIAQAAEMGFAWTGHRVREIYLPRHEADLAP